MNRKYFVLFSLAAVLIFGACEVREEKTQADASADAAVVTARFDLSDDAGFFDAPFPIEHMRRWDETVRFELLPNAEENPFADFYLRQAGALPRGFSRIGAVFFAFDGAVDIEALPARWQDSIAPDAPIFLVNVDPQSPRRGERIPLAASFHPHEDDYNAPYLLAVLPFQGAPLAPGELYAAVVMRSLGDSYGRPLGRNDAFQNALAGRMPSGDNAARDAAAFAALADSLEGQGIDAEEVAVATVYRASDPVAPMRRLRDAVRALPDPAPKNLRVIADYPTYYVIEGRISMPIWQAGPRPYMLQGGGIEFDGAGEPVLQWWEDVRFSVSVPKRPMPTEGFPLLFYANGQGGTYTQVFDRGPAGKSDNGEGPGKVFAHRGIACLDIEAPLAGPRHPWGSSEHILFFNPLNLTSYGDNPRQAASEFTYLIKAARVLEIDPALVPDVDPGGSLAIVYDPENFFFWGHSTGASIGNLVLGVEPDFRAGMLSGAGASWIYNLIYKQEPLPLGDIFKLVLGAGWFDEYHPIPTVFQTAAEIAEAADFAPHVLRDPLGADPPRDVLLIGGYFDRYFPPRLIESLAVALGVDLAGEVVDADAAEALEKLAGRGVVDLPVSGNVSSRGRDVTAVLLQFQAPEGEDGHYVAFQLNAPRYQYGCFFDSLARTGKAVVPPPNEDPYAPCP